MVSMDWTTCCKKNLAKSIRIDTPLIDSLRKSSSKKMQTQEMLDLDATTATSKISLTYDSLREVLEALSLSHGFKIYNHECYCSFLKDILKKSDLGDSFDAFRKLRNSINYYGKDVSIEEAASILKEMKILTEKINSLF
jgi:uncharacterized protein (UPF0332 family)